jgi:uncharacterized protein YrzB (UPF0473 family)
MITIEKKNDNEVVISLDEQGGEELISILTRLVKTKEVSHEHLYTKEWGGIYK